MNSVSGPSARRAPALVKGFTASGVASVPGARLSHLKRRGGSFSPLRVMSVASRMRFGVVGREKRSSERPISSGASTDLFWPYLRSAVGRRVVGRDRSAEARAARRVPRIATTSCVLVKYHPTATIGSPIAAVKR